MDSSVYLDGYVTVCHLISGLIGIPLNILIMVFIVGLRRLHLQRTFTWLGIGFSNILILTYNLAELVAVHWPSPFSSSLCAFLTGLCASMMIFNWLLSLLERYLCIKHSKWYRRHITSCWIVLATQIGLFIILCLISKSHYFIDSSNSLRRWQWDLQDLKLIGSFCLAGFLVCVITHGVVWLGPISRKYPPVGSIVFYRQIGLQAQRPEQQQLGEDQQVEPELIAVDIESQQQQSSSFVQIGEERVSRLDLEAARCISISFWILLILAVPAMFSVIQLALCLKWTSNMQECNDWVKILIYSRTLIVLHCFIIGPVLFVFLSRDLRSAMRDRGFYWL